MALWEERLMYVGERETKWLFVILFTSQFLLGAVRTFAICGTSAAALSALLCCIVPIVLLCAAEKLSGGLGGDFTQILQRCYGKCAAAVIELIIFALAVSNASLRLKAFVTALSRTVYPGTPNLYLTAFFTFVMLCVCFLGAENITRYARLAGIGMSLVLVLVLAMAVPHFEEANICPVFGSGAAGILRGTFAAQAFADVIYLYFIGRLLRNDGAPLRVGIKAAVISAVIIVIVTLAYALCVPYPASSVYEYPFFRLATLANASVLFQRLDGAVYITWIFAGFICTGALALFCSMIFADGFKCSDYKGSAPLVVLIISALSLSSLKAVKILNTAFAPSVLAVILITALIYRTRGGKNEN